jgi:hypothetical protein
MPDPEIQPPSEFQADVQANGIRQLKPMLPESEKIQPKEIAAIRGLAKLPGVDQLYQPGGKREFDRDSPQGIAKSLHHSHVANQVLIRDRDTMQREFNLKLRNAVILAILGWVPGIAAFGIALWLRLKP